MADPTPAHEALVAVRTALAAEFGSEFTKKDVELVSGTSRPFAAVAADGSVVATVVHWFADAAEGRKPTGKLHAAVSSLYYLSLAKAATRLLVATDLAFLELLREELDGAVAPGVELRHVAIPDDVATRLRSA